MQKKRLHLDSTSHGTGGIQGLLVPDRGPFQNLPQKASTLARCSRMFIPQNHSSPIKGEPSGVPVLEYDPLMCVAAPLPQDFSPRDAERTGMLAYALNLEGLAGKKECKINHLYFYTDYMSDSNILDTLG